MVNERAKEHRWSMLGRTEEILVEERNVKIPTQVIGERTKCASIVYFPGEIDEL
jgi:tRNA-2-methylthio-N6-dimethylallyladenosine synthase